MMQLDQPISLKLQPHSLGSESTCHYLTNLCETRNPILGAGQSLYHPQILRLEKKKRGGQMRVFLKAQTASLAPSLPCQGQIQI